MAGQFIENLNKALKDKQLISTETLAGGFDVYYDEEVERIRFENAEVKQKQIQLNDDIERKELMLQLNERGCISSHAVFDRLGLNYEEEILRLRNENIDVQKNLAVAGPFGNVAIKEAPEEFNGWRAEDPERPATEADIEEIQRQLSQVANDPNLTLTTIHAIDYKNIPGFEQTANGCTYYNDIYGMTNAVSHDHLKDLNSIKNVPLVADGSEWVWPKPEKSLRESYLDAMELFTSTDGPFKLVEGHTNDAIQTQFQKINTAVIPGPNAQRLRNHIGFVPKKIVAKHVAGGYKPAAQSVVQQLISGNYSAPQTVKTRQQTLRSFEGTVYGRVVINE